jgi:signal transduction histidine kinase
VLVINLNLKVFENRIAVKLSLSFIVMILICMVTIGLLFMQLFKHYAFDSRENSMLRSARSISEVAAEVMTSTNGFSPGPGNPMRGFGSYIRSLDILTDSKVWITDKKGNLTVISGRVLGQGMGQGRGGGLGQGQGFLNNSEPLPREAETVIQDVLKGKESVSESFSSIYNEATITIGVPIADTNHSIIGVVLLHSPVTGVVSALNKAESILSISLLAALLLAVALGIFYSLIFTHPLKAMNRSALEISKGNYSARTGVRRKDELGQLGNSLDLLATELGSTINQLFQEKGKLNDIISCISEGIVAFDKDLKPISFNLALSGILNRPLPYQLEDVDRDMISLEIKPSLDQLLKTKTSAQIHRDWLDKKLIFTISPIVDQQNTVTGCVALVQDISESERHEQLRRDFVANVSHEFRTPLTVIRGYLEAMTDGTIETSEEVKLCHRRMLSETHSLERLVKDLLELSRLQSGKIPMNREEIHLPSLVSDTIRSLQNIALKKSINLIYSLEPDVPPFLGDYDRLRQLLIIFLDNSVKYSPDHSEVNVEASLKGMTIVLTIRDEGYGIAPDKLPQIWDRFYKGDQSRNSSGSGLGLAIAKALVEVLQGRIEIKSQLKKGTVVTLRLPIEFQA